MAFDPLDWIALADELAARGNEAAARTAIGRYYYGVFLKSRDSLTHDNLLTPRFDDSDHRAVMTALHQNKRSAAGTALDNLRRTRNRADYDTGKFDPLDTSAAKVRAGEVIRMCSADWARLS